MRKTLEAKAVLPNIKRTQAAERDESLSLVTLILKLVGARDQTRLPCEFGANPFSGYRDISHSNKKVTDSAKTQNRTLRSSLCAVKVHYTKEVVQKAECRGASAPLIRCCPRTHINDANHKIYTVNHKTVTFYF